MSILVDLNQVVISNLMQQIGGSRSTMKLEEDLIRHMVLNSLRSYTRKFKKDYGQLVICCDNKHYWRRDAFPFYKANRKKDRDKSNFDWGMIFETMNKLRQELKDNFPYKVIDIDGAEADDIIATLTKLLAPHEKILILSSDKDFAQLQKYPSVKQFSPTLNKFIETDDPIKYIREHIIRGDKGDGIPNFLSPDDTFVSGGRQKVINKKKLEDWLSQSPETFCVNDTLKHGYARNQMLVDFTFIPEELAIKITETYWDLKPASKQKMFKYFIDKRLKNLIEVIDEFH